MPDNKNYERVKEWRRKNKEKLAEYQHRYFLKHREKILEYQRNHRHEIKHISNAEESKTPEV
jgi:hypothetical protein